jgi:ABC-type spermidine/putrescine transport system permease subunit I
MPCFTGFVTPQFLREVTAMKEVMNLIRNESGHAYAGYGVGSAIVLVLVVLLLLWLL